ncbi:ABC transporter permease [Micromonospora sp. NPDC048935]|uniref:ABC transporter permease n=1 Tax=Micromonospora sp. NPDC048935 TaxID=3364262 RepID=UPI0037122275
MMAIQARTSLVYRSNYLVNVVAVVFQVYLLRILWTAVYQGRPEVAGVSLGIMITYATFANVQTWVTSPWEFSLIPPRVREGQIAGDLTRPIGFTTQIHARQVGRALATAPFVAATLPLAVLVGGGRAPAGLAAAFGYALSMVLAYLVSAMLSVLVGMIAFWTMETTGIFVIYRVVFMFFSGALVPLWFMPDALRLVAEALPFQAVTYAPLAIYLGHAAAADVPNVLALQAFWVVLLWLGGRLVWSRAVHRVVIQGG